MSTGKLFTVKWLKPSDEVGEYKKISPEEAKIRLDSGENITLLDVRTLDEYNSGHIPGSILVPLHALENEISSRVPDKNMAIVAYCATGRRSRRACEILIRLGYRSVYDLGGIGSWPHGIEK